MMMVVLIGGVMCCGMSCVGGLGLWYMKDECLGGVLCPATSTASDSTTTGDSTSTSTAADPAATVPTGSDVYLYSKLCADGGGGYSVLSGNPSAADNNHVQMGCKIGRTDGWKTFWKIEKGPNKFYYINLSGTKQYLTWEDDGTTDSNGKQKGKPVLRDKTKDPNYIYRQLWWIGKQSDGSLSLSLSESKNQTVGGRYLSYHYEACSNPKSVNAPWAWGKEGHHSKWGIRKKGDKSGPKMGNSCGTAPAPSTASS